MNALSFITFSTLCERSYLLEWRMRLFIPLSRHLDRWAIVHNEDSGSSPLVVTKLTVFSSKPSMRLLSQGTVGWAPVPPGTIDWLGATVLVRLPVRFRCHDDTESILNRLPYSHLTVISKEENGRVDQQPHPEIDRYKYRNQYPGTAAESQLQL